MLLLPEINAQIAQLQTKDTDKLEVLAQAMEDCGLDASAVWEEISDINELWYDLMLAKQELVDGGY